ncbi:MAG TPA: FAD-dependent oxidoreductase, partial [Thermaerobacter sp.]
MIPVKGVPSDALSHRPDSGPRDADAGSRQTNLRDAGSIGVLQPRYDVVVVGAGLIGLATAFELARQGARVAVVEAGRPGSGASTVAAGMLAPGHEAKADPLLRELGL